MRTINHHLQIRGETYYLVKRIPYDVRSLHGGAEWLRESLKTRNVVTARKMRDARLSQLDGQWSAYRMLPSGQHLSREEMRVALRYRERVLNDDDREGWLRAVDERASEIYDDDIPEGLHGQVGSELAGEFHDIASGTKLPTRIANAHYLEAAANLKPSTRDMYRAVLKQLAAHFEFVESMTWNSVREFLREYQKTRTRKAISNLMTAGRSMLAFHGHDTSVFDGHRIDPGKAMIEKGTWTDDELLRLQRSNSPQWLRDIITLAMYSGFRRKELCGLVYDAEKNQLVVTKAVAKTDNSVRRVPCHPAAKDAAIRIASRKEPIRLKAVTDGFRELRETLGIPRLVEQDGKVFKRDFHAVRHTFGSKLATLDADDWRISRILGHGKKTVTQRYAAKHDPEVDRELIERVCYRSDRE